MDKLECPCGFSHDLSEIPDDGWVTVRDQDYQRLLRVEIQRTALSAALAETPDWEALVAADAELETLHGVLYQCPQCGRLLWKKPGDDSFTVFTPDSGTNPIPARCNSGGMSTGRSSSGPHSARLEPMKGDPSPSRRPATYADIQALPEHVVGEIVGGELTVTPRPAPRHALSASRLGAKLCPPFDIGDGGPGGWWILDEPELHLDQDVLVPDLAGWRRERMTELPDTAWFELAPDWVCEVLSASTARHDRATKLPVYAREKVSHVWLVDPDARTLEILRLQKDGYLVASVHGGDQVVRAEPFEAIELDLLVLWGETRPGDEASPNAEGE